MVDRDVHPELPDDPDRPGPSRPAAGDVVIVFAGGVVGTAARYAASEIIGSYGRWPTATFLINLTGAFVLGLLLEALARRGPDIGRRRAVRLLLGTGFCGAFTTYSALAVETEGLLRDGLVGFALAYGFGTVIIGFVATMAGIWCGSRTVRSAP